jgi:hypothetical protein
LFSITYSHDEGRFGSIWFQNLNRADRDSSQKYTQDNLINSEDCS